MNQLFNYINEDYISEENKKVLNILQLTDDKNFLLLCQNLCNICSQFYDDPNDDRAYIMIDDIISGATFTIVNEYEKNGTVDDKWKKFLLKRLFTITALTGLAAALKGQVFQYTPVGRNKQKYDIRVVSINWEDVLDNWFIIYFKPVDDSKNNFNIGDGAYIEFHTHEENNLSDDFLTTRVGLVCYNYSGSSYQRNPDEELPLKQVNIDTIKRVLLADKE